MKQILLILGLAILTLQSCKKYSEGPVITFTTPEYRIQRSWVLEKAMYGTTDITESYKTLVSEIIVKKGGEMQVVNPALTLSYNWEFAQNKSVVKTKQSNANTWYDNTVLKLTTKEFWYYYTDNGIKVEVKLKAK